VTRRDRWREPYTILWWIADSPTYDDLVVRWAEFGGAARRFAAATYGQWRRALDRDGRLRLDVRDVGLKLALQELVERVLSNAVFADPRADAMKWALLGLDRGPRSRSTAP
jgi:hypothetical protein